MAKGMIMLFSRLRRAVRPYAKKGFTLTEVIVVLLIVAILAAVLIPSFIALIRHGQQRNRENIARTLYIAMQNQLTRAEVEGNLRTMLTDGFYLEDEHINDQLIEYFSDSNAVGRVADGLGALFPISDLENIDNVYYICKPSDYTLGDNEIIDKFYALMDEVVVSKEILDGTILMEFNVRTGVVMSIFYGDDLSGQSVFVYDNSNRNTDIVGERGMESSYPDEAYSRRQGYFGVDYTGVAPLLPIDDIVRIFDGMDYDDGMWQLTDSPGDPQPGLNVSPDVTNPIRETNVLFAEFLLQAPMDEQHIFYIFDIDNKNKETRTMLRFNDPDDPLSSSLVFTDFRAAIEQSQYSNNHTVYLDTDTRIVVNQNGIDIGGVFNRYIWILDFIEEDIFSQPNNIIEKYSNINTPMNIRAGISTDDGQNIESQMYANTHFLNKWPSGVYEVNSVRHLNNISYVPDGDFVQTNHIDVRTLINRMRPETEWMYNFRPITNLTGSYNAVLEKNLQWRIEHLIINTKSKSAQSSTQYDENNIGLFSIVEGNIVGLSLFDAEIIAQNSDNVGTIAGLLDGGQIIHSSSFANVVGGTGNTGGLIGRIENKGVLSHSFNAGFFNTHIDTRTFYYQSNASGEDVLIFTGIGSVMADGGNIGGLVGRNNGKIANSFNNARVNIADVELDPDTYQSINYTPTETPLSGTNLGGIAGLNESKDTIVDSYATNFVAIYSESDINTGGIAGTNIGTIRNCRYIANGATDSGVDWDPATKAESSDMNPGWLPSGYEMNISFHNSYDDGVRKNLYTQYPYPILSNNNPFSFIYKTISDPTQESREMGWEDILSERVTYAGALVYYEFYTDLMPRYESPFSAITIVPTGSPRYVTHDGYAIEFYPSSQGYILEFGEGYFYTITQFEDEWRVFAIVDGVPEAMPDENWLPAEQFTPTANIPVSSEENPVMYRIYIPNELALERANSPVTIRLIPGADTVIDEIDSSANILSRANVGVIGEYNPLFANFTSTTNASIRSARHMDNINLVADDPYSAFTQHLNIDFAVNYYREVTISSGGTVTTDVATRRIFTGSAVISEQFAGRFDGMNMWIANLMINAPGASNVGLFAENAGTIERVTLRLLSYTTDTIVGGSNVGGIVGRNLGSGTVRSCFVQQVVTRDSRGQLPAWNLHPAAVKGVSNVGGVVGDNLGALTDVIFTSTSARPAVSGTTSTTFGGIVGSTTNEVDNIMYLAVAPRTGTGRAAMRPFTGSGNQVGQNAVYLSGGLALRPFQTSIDGITLAQTDYNLLTTGQELSYPAMNTQGIVERYAPAQFNSNWTINNTAGINFEAVQLFPTFMYPYPKGTVPPINMEWPVVAPMIVPPNLGVIYYEKYSGGEVGIFARYIDEYGQIKTIDYLRYDNPIIVEAGYGAQMTGGLSGNRPVAYSQYTANGWSDITDRNNNRLNASDQGNQMQLDTVLLNVPYLPGRQFVYFPQALLISAADKAPNPIEPMIIWINISTSQQIQQPGVYALINPFFAKEVYPITLGGLNGSAPILRDLDPLHPTEHVVRTPWQLQNISLYIQKSLVLCDDKEEHEHTFIQEIDIDMTRVASTQAEPSRGLGVNLVSPLGTTTSVNELSNIVMGTFRGVYDGQGNKITNLSLTYTGANNKGLFKTIDADGVVENLTIYDSKIQGGSDNGSFASVNNGTIRNVAYIYANSDLNISQQPITGTGATGGIAGTNNGTIENALFLAQASGASPGVAHIAPVTATGTGIEINAYYLSGTYASALRPTRELVAANFNIFTDVSTIRGEPRTTQELNAINTFITPWTQSIVPSWRNAVDGTTVADNPYPFLGVSATITWPVATIPAKDIVYYEEYTDGTVGFYSVQGSSGLPSLDNDMQITNYGYAIFVDRPGSFGCSINTNAGNNIFIHSTVRPGASDGTNYNYAKIPTGYITGISGEIHVNDQSTNYWIDARFAKAVYLTQSAAINPTEIYVRTPQQMIQISNLTTTADITFIQERDLDFTNVSLGSTATGVVSRTFNGTFDGGGNLILGLTINYTQSGLSMQTSYVGLFSQNNGTVCRVTLVFENTPTSMQQIRGSVNSISGSEVYVGAIAGQNTGIISDVSVISTLRDSSGYNAYAPVGGTDAYIGGIVGENAGSIARVLYLAPAPTDNINIYPITNTEVGTNTIYSNVFYLGGTSDAIIIDTSTMPITGTGDIIGPVNGYNYSELMQPISGPIMVDTDALYAMVNVSSSWTNQSPPIWSVSLSAPEYDFIYQNTYPYINRVITSTQSVPAAWPVVSVKLMETEGEIEEVLDWELEEISDTVSNIIQDNDSIANSDGASNIEETRNHEGSYNNPNDTSNNNALNENSDTHTNDIDSTTDNNDDVSDANEADVIIHDESTAESDNSTLVTGVITLLGGAGLTQTKAFKNFMRRRDKRAVRRINYYNNNKRDGRRVDRYILRHCDAMSRLPRRYVKHDKGGVDDAVNK